MKAFVEWLCDHAGIVRAGPLAEKYGDPFDYAVTVLKVAPDAVVIKALASDGKLTVGHVRAALKALAQIGLRATWERVK